MVYIWVFFPTQAFFFPSQESHITEIKIIRNNQIWIPAWNILQNALVSLTDLGCTFVIHNKALLYMLDWSPWLLGNLFHRRWIRCTVNTIKMLLLKTSDKLLDFFFFFFWWKISVCHVTLLLCPFHVLLQCLWESFPFKCIMKPLCLLASTSTELLLSKCLSHSVCLYWSLESRKRVTQGHSKIGTD